MTLLTFAIKGKYKKSDQQSSIVACSLLRWTVTMVCCKSMVNFIADFYFSTNIPHSCIQTGIAAYIFQTLRPYTITDRCHLLPRFPPLQGRGSAECEARRAESGGGVPGEGQRAISPLAIGDLGERSKLPQRGPRKILNLVHFGTWKSHQDSVKWWFSYCQSAFNIHTGTVHTFTTKF